MTTEQEKKAIELTEQLATVLSEIVDSREQARVRGKCVQLLYLRKRDHAKN